jgi:hypothetical protein
MVIKRGTYVGEVSLTLSGASGVFIRSDELALCLLGAVIQVSKKLLVPRAFPTWPGACGLARGAEARMMSATIIIKSLERYHRCLIWRDMWWLPLPL